MSRTYYSEYGYVTSRYFSSATSTVHSHYFSSDYGLVSYKRPNLTEFMCFSIKSKGEYEFHGIGLLNGTGFPIAHKSSESEFTSKLSNQDYAVIEKEMVSGTITPHFLSSSIFETHDKSLILASASNKPEAYLYHPSSHSTTNHNIEFDGFSSPLKMRGVTSDTGEDCYVVYDDANDISFVCQGEIVGESSSSSLSTDIMELSSSSGPLSQSSSRHIESVVSSEYELDCETWSRKAIYGISDLSFLGSIVLNGITDATSDSGDLYLCIYTTFDNMIPAEYRAIILKSPEIHPLIQENIMAYGSAFAPADTPYVCPITPALKSDSKQVSNISGYIEFLGVSLRLKNTISLIKLSCVYNPLHSSESSSITS